MPNARYVATLQGQYTDRTYPSFELNTGGSMFWGDSETANQFDDYPNTTPSGTWMIFDWTTIDNDSGGTAEWSSQDVDWTVDIQAGAHRTGRYTLSSAAGTTFTSSTYVRLLSSSAYGTQLGVGGAAPTDANLLTSTVVPYLDQSADALKFRSKWSDGTYHTYTVYAAGLSPGVGGSGWDPGAVPFGHASDGTLIEDPTNFLFDNTSNQLRLAATGSGAGILIGGDTQWYRSAANQLRTPDDVIFDTRIIQGTAATTDFAGGAQVLAGDDTNLLVVLGTFDDTNDTFFDLLRGKGTTASPTAVTSGTALGRVGFRGQYGTSVGQYSTGARGYMSAQTSEDWTASANGTNLDFYATANGSTTPTRYLRIRQDGMLLIGDSTDTKVYRLGANNLALDTGDTLTCGSWLYPSTPAQVHQSSAGLFAGSGAPNNANGNNGDFYLRSDGGALTTIYHKRAGSWVGVI